MTNLHKVYFPLRSNIGWFQNIDLQREITNRVKQALLFYDELIIEDGTFEAEIVDNGGFYPYHPPGSLSSEYRTIEYERDIKQTDMFLAVGQNDSSPRHAVINGTTIARFKVDYYNIFKEIDVESYDFINFIVTNKYQFPKEAQNLINQINWHDKKIFNEFEENGFLRNLVISNLNYDLITSTLLESAVILDSKHQELLRKKCMLPDDVLKFYPVKEGEIIRNLLTLSVPNFDELSLQTVLELREDHLWKDFRNFIGQISDLISANPELLIDSKELNYQIESIIAKETLKELENRYPSGDELMLDIGMGLTSLIPGYGLIPTAVSTTRTIKKYLTQKSGWFAFLMKLKRSKN